ncbi:N-acetylmuramic acid 6-phosphate etherase [Bacillus fonticola]|uniref:N-acetylmuramic acid 6-phosphate etherase n=1 Tax=Bacillus fonticola TaxID=2728853 RepID=UPI00147604E5|nr:N-acetylmuramic acid 6-phosphate etherase [Bacillus fonticola]
MIDHLTTEKRNSKTTLLDQLPILEALRVMNTEDKTVPVAIEKELPLIVKVVEAVRETFQNGNRLFYIGAGTSGRLGVLDAVECPPTFGASYEQVQGIIAGGAEAYVKAEEGAEDSEEAAALDLQNHGVRKGDVVIALAASGRTPYAIGALKKAKELGAVTASVSCNKKASMSTYADYPIEVETGPEVLTGSTRLKAGTAQKLVLNMISTLSMVGIGKVYENLMVDMKSTNEKLQQRSLNIIQDATGVTEEVAQEYFEASERHVKTAIVMILSTCSLQEAKNRLLESKGFVRGALQSN